VGRAQGCLKEPVPGVDISLFVSGHLHVKGTEEKMSKSLKNYITIKVTSIDSAFLREWLMAARGLCRVKSHH
jgi:methionyl-tRNA synthetase